jgi:hypothetical protein
VIRGSHCFQALEEERLQQLKDLAACYLNHLQEMGPKMIQVSQGDGFLRVIKICSTLFFGWEVRPEAPCHKILQHVKNYLQV